MEPAGTGLERLILAPKPGGRPPTYGRREIVNAVLYQLRCGATWRMMPHDLPPWGITYHYWRAWRKDGTWERAHDTLRTEVRQSNGEECAAQRGDCGQSIGKNEGPRRRGWL